VAGWAYHWIGETQLCTRQLDGSAQDPSASAWRQCESRRGGTNQRDAARLS
jgi:hypothetical protein